MNKVKVKMRFNPQLKEDIEKFADYVILVEGQKDVLALKSLGFEKVYAIDKNAVSSRERVEQICLMVNRKDKVCILTDFDKKGKKLYYLVKSIIQEYGLKIDSSLRGILLKANLSHIEGLATFMKKVDKI